MAKIEDLISRIPDDRLREAIASEVKELKKSKRFGLVFEEHLPETVRLPFVQIRKGSLVAKKAEPGNACWVVRAVKGKNAECLPEGEKDYTKKPEVFAIKDLVAVKPFGEPIFPKLTPIDRVARGGPDKPWHVLINADNFHALQLLLYCYERQVDVIYIDPPYNSGARDWKYNNDYVDKTDSFRHSKWLSMMRKRLLLAKRLLKPDGVIIITIDENELNHLAVLMDDIFPDRLRHMLTIIINPKGAGKKNFARTEEHALFCIPVTSKPIVNANLLKDLSRVGLDKETLQEESDEDEAQKMGAPGQIVSLPGDITPDQLPFPIEEIDQWELRHARRRGNESSYRHQRKNQFYPIYINPTKRTVEEIGDSIPLDVEPDTRKKNNLLPVWPIDKEGNHRCWRFIPSSMRSLHEDGKLVVGRQDSTSGTWTLNYWTPASVAKKVKTVWWHTRHDAGTHGTSMLHKILGKRDAFPFPKSLYAVRDTLLTVVGDRPDAVVLDFFAGSGTTLHATALINAQLGGSRRCILVSNNEPGEKTVKRLVQKGLFPGDAEFETAGICESVTWPRSKFSINGCRESGASLAGTYLDLESHQKNLKWKDGFAENLEYFRLDFVEPSDVERGEAFEGILPILWMMAGCIGEREDRRGGTPYYIAKHSPFAVLIKEAYFSEFEKKLAERDDLTHIFLVTDSEENFAMMRRELGRGLKCHQLYKSYLENFRLNAAEAFKR